MRVGAEDEGRERSFALDELFFSTTDERGFIRSSNEVFLRVSGYAADELHGRPHNTIRHPSMPRIVFRVLWDHLEAGLPVAAYVQNRAKDGAPYWVLAAARPVPGGFLSVRLKPTSPWFGVVRSLYGELRRAESEVELGGGSRTDAMARSGAALVAALQELVGGDYDAFMTAAFADEVRARRRGMGPASDRHAWTGDLRAAALARLADHLDQELDRLDAAFTLNDELARSCSDLVRLADEGSTLAFNAELAGGRLGADGGALKAVAELMRDVCPAIVRDAEQLLRQIDAARRELRQVGFDVALASLQNDMARRFLAEVARGNGGAAADASIELLVSCVRHDTERVAATLAAVTEHLDAVSRRALALRRRLDLLATIERNGRVEAVRTAGAAPFHTLFEQVRSQVSAAVDETGRIDALVAGYGVEGHRAARAGLLGELSRLEQ